MKITVFTSNQPRHISFIRKLSGIADQVYAVQECSTLFPGAVQDSIYNSSPVMKEYFEHVTRAEQEQFGDVSFTPGNVKTLSLKMGDIAGVMPERISEALQSDYYIVFGASYIRPPLVDVLIEKRAVNIHMGVSPYFRGSSCNFWAIHDGHSELVGATIHLLSRGLDSGAMLFHALPEPVACDPFVLGMKAVSAAHNGLCNHIKNGTLGTMKPVFQDKTQQIRYSRHAEFNDNVAQQYLQSLPSADTVFQHLKKHQNRHALLRPYYG